MTTMRHHKGFSRNNVLQTPLEYYQQLKDGRRSRRHKHLDAPLSDINLYVVATKDYFAFLLWSLNKSVP